jgi:hypothetical protein
MKIPSALLAVLFFVAACASEDDTSFRAAGQKPCKVTNLKSAEACADKIPIEDAEEINDIGVTVANKKTRAAMTRVLNGLVETSLLDADDGFFNAQEAVAEANYLIVLMQHQDEDLIFYFTLQKGNKVKPQPLVDFRFADIDPYPIDTLPLDWALLIEDMPGWHYDDFEVSLQYAVPRE